MDKITLTRAEAADLLGISTATVTAWVRTGRLKAYRVSDKPRSPYLFTKDDCMAALTTVVSQAQKDSHVEPSYESADGYKYRDPKRVNEELHALLKIRKNRKQ
ncbi:helix-turn-helix domain-containing protein [Leclercia adecarboxylata]|uniref:helix-turn-helix domain-containing protein n=1 Tax=Leclercia adecarboxylata TaxID=83655 RepID=UPI002DB7A0CD|nr:helix-turn-helix domain-containing protein [Leclercia adecarboxylata]MEB6378821.1 helix-turn-helix domain-containing protein [Leclercia adecarboxylata]